MLEIYLEAHGHLKSKVLDEIFPEGDNTIYVYEIPLEEDAKVLFCKVRHKLMPNSQLFRDGDKLITISLVKLDTDKKYSLSYLDNLNMEAQASIKFKSDLAVSMYGIQQ
jgi:hypothetical protein